METKILAVSKTQFRTTVSVKEVVPYLSLECKMNYNIKEEQDYLFSDNMRDCKVPAIGFKTYINQNSNKFKIEDDTHNVSFSSDIAYADLEFEKKIKIEEDTHNISFSSDAAYAELEFQGDVIEMDDDLKFVYINGKQEFKVDEDVHSSINSSQIIYEDENGEMNVVTGIHNSNRSSPILLWNENEESIVDVDDHNTIDAYLIDYQTSNNDSQVDEAVNSIINTTSDYFQIQSPNCLESFSYIPEIMSDTDASQRNYLNNLFNDTLGIDSANENSSDGFDDVDCTFYTTNTYEYNYGKSKKAQKIVDCMSGLVQDSWMHQNNYAKNNSTVKSNGNSNFSELDDALSHVKFTNSISSAENVDIQRIREWIITNNLSQEQTDTLLQILRQRMLPNAPMSGNPLINSDCPPASASRVNREGQNRASNKEMITEKDSKNLFKEDDNQLNANILKMCNNNMDASMNYIIFTSKHCVKLPIDTLKKFRAFDLKIKMDLTFYKDLSAFIVSRLFKFNKLHYVLFPIFQLILTKNVRGSFILKEKSAYSTKIVFLETAFSQCLSNVIKKYGYLCSKVLLTDDHYVNAIRIIINKSRISRPKVHSDDSKEIQPT